MCVLLYGSVEDNRNIGIIVVERGDKFETIGPVIIGDRHHIPELIRGGFIGHWSTRHQLL